MATVSPTTVGVNTIGSNTIRPQTVTPTTTRPTTIGSNTKNFSGGTSGGGGAGGDFGSPDADAGGGDTGGLSGGDAGGGGSGSSGGDGLGLIGSSTVEVSQTQASWSGSGIAGLQGGQQAIAAALEAIYSKVKCLEVSETGEPTNLPGNPDLKRLEDAIGIDEFPVSVPLSFYGDSDDLTELNNLPEMVSWLAQQVDAVMGQFPAQIQQTNQAGETQMIEFKNLAEALVELYGISAQTAIDADYAARGMISNTAETVAAKNAALVTQDYVVANSDHLGYRGNPKVRKVRYSVNPTADTPQEFLQPFEGEIIGWEYQDKGTVKEDLIALRHSGGIVKAAFSRTAGQLAELGFDAIIKEFTQQDDGWDEFIRKWRNPRDPRNLNQEPPRIIDRSQGNEE